jgi:hypothetical protein
VHNIGFRYGLSIFSGNAVNILPITNDKNLFITFLENINEKSILNG